MTFDLATLTVTDSDEPLTRAGGAGRPKIDNPFGPIVLDSMSRKGSTKVIVLPMDKERGKTNEPRNVTTVKGLIRRAAEDNNLGVKIVVTEDVKAGTSTIRFAAKEKTERPRSTDVTADAPKVANSPKVADAPKVANAPKVADAPKPGPAKVPAKV